MPEVIRRDPLAPLVAIVSAVVYTLHGFHGALTRDLGLYSYAGQQVADGVPPYLGLLNRAGPLAHVLPAIGALLGRALGADQVVTMRVVFMVFATAAVVVTYLLGRDLLDSRAAGLVAASGLLSFHGFIQYASDGPREKTPMVLFVVLALWAVTRRRWLTAGICTSLATLCLQTAFFSTFAAVVVAAILVPVAHGDRVRGRLVALLRVALGGLVPVAVLAAWFALAGSLRESWDAFYVINRRYTVPDPILDLDQVWLGLQEAYGATAWLLLGGAAALVVVTLAAVVPRARRAFPALEVLPAMTAGLLAGLWWITKEYDSWADLFPLLPFAALGMGAAAAVVVRRLAPRPRWLLAAAAAVTCLALALDYSLTTRDDTLDLQREATEAVLAELPDGATITSVEGPQPLVLTDRTNPTRYQMFRSGLQDYMDDTWPGGLDGFKRDLVADGPDLVSTGETVSLTWRRALTPDYVFVGRAPQWEWYARADLGEETIARLREAADYDPADPFAVLEDSP
ncbi:glycosyltransferase family 39 protein [Nocardioides KLBMP 9356]|uniref:Glycosyltransferase family 39 protein n=1 Tax=Nocardioides potassii TaxID=2911371 RepID=A0ABS9HFY1_9ACTN|nr:glycosyltransferase family 39 protein [Nocardioides potassii]MCF6379261.1 glycosyltransferase family 39 protein [Nocardioides potassii]